jgi:hypothetical protein
MIDRGSLILVCVTLGLAFTPDPGRAEDAKKPAILIINGRHHSPLTNGDFVYFRQLHERGFQIDTHFLNENPARPVTWDLIKRYNCLVVMDLPCDEEQKNDNWSVVTWDKTVPPYRKEMQGLLEKFLAEGGGVFFLPDLQDSGLKATRKYESYLETWGARLPYEMIQDPATATVHPRDTMTFVYTENVAASPVSAGVKGLWLPVEPMSYWSLHTNPLLVSGDWIQVVRGADTSYTKEPTLPYRLDAEEERHFRLMTHRPDPKSPPTLYAIRDLNPGRLALAAVFPIYTLRGGTTWIHDGVVLDQGLAGRPSHFGKLLENTLHWLSEPSVASGKLGGYAQDPRQLLHPHLRKKPDEQFPRSESQPVLATPANVYRGLVGARTRYSTGQSTVDDYAAAAKQAGLDFLVFLEEFGDRGGLRETKYRQLEADCRRLSSDTLFLMPGFTFRNNIGNRMFAYGHGIAWPTPTQFVGANHDELRHQCFDRDGKLALNDEDAKNWIWPLTGVSGRNIGYYRFAGGAGMPVRDLRLFGILGLMTYVDGKLVEDLTQEYLNYVIDGDPPLACAVDLIQSTEGLTRAVQDRHYLTLVAANRLQDLPTAMCYGHQYGRANVYPSSGPRIRSWAGTQRVLTFAGEPFVPARYRIRPVCWVASDVGLKEIVIFCDKKPFRRFLLHGAKEFKQTFEWAFDRQRVLTLEVTDVEGRRALSAGFESWCDANFNTWCHDRQNGELWHGPLTFAGTRLPLISVGPTWDGGPPPPACFTCSVHPGVSPKPGVYEGVMFGWGGRIMAGDMWPTCIDDSVANIACRGDHNYAPGEVANAYHTLGPLSPSGFMTFEVRRTQYLQRPVGPNRDWHAMWSERQGGNLALIEGRLTFRKDTPLEGMHFLWVAPQNFPKNGSNLPLLAIRRSNDSRLICGPFSSVYERGRGVPPALGLGSAGEYLLQPGGYFAFMPSGEGIASAIFNMGADPVTATPWGAITFGLPVHGRTFKAGESLAWRYLVISDGLDQPIHNLHRIERLWEYFGLNGKSGSGLVVRRGKLLSHFGLVDLEAEGGIVEFEVPAPDFPLQMPLGLRFVGFKPNWTLGQYQISGYSMGHYTDGSRVYRNLATDDRQMAYLAVYPDGVPKTHSIVGHPVQCDRPELIIEFAQLRVQPPEYRVAVNNPTDAPIKTTLKKCIDLPGFDFPDRPLEVSAGAYLVVREK